MHRLYVFVNTDLPSMTPGKAANATVYKIRNTSGTSKVLSEWEGNLGFGTQINLYAPWETVLSLIETFRGVYPCGVVNDPTYPYIASSELLDLLPNKILAIDRKDGNHMYFRAQDTAAWFFCTEDNIELGNVMKVWPLA
jgi:hypothetical protein